MAGTRYVRFRRSHCAWPRQLASAGPVHESTVPLTAQSKRASSKLETVTQDSQKRWTMDRTILSAERQGPIYRVVVPNSFKLLLD